MLPVALPAVHADAADHDAEGAGVVGWVAGAGGVVDEVKPRGADAGGGGEGVQAERFVDDGRGVGELGYEGRVGAEEGGGGPGVGAEVGGVLCAEFGEDGAVGGEGRDEVAEAVACCVVAEGREC